MFSTTRFHIPTPIAVVLECPSFILFSLQYSRGINVYVNTHEPATMAQITPAMNAPLSGYSSVPLELIPRMIISASNRVFVQAEKAAPHRTKGCLQLASPIRRRYPTSSTMKKWVMHIMNVDTRYTSELALWDTMPSNDKVLTIDAGKVSMLYPRTENRTLLGRFITWYVITRDDMKQKELLTMCAGRIDNMLLLFVSLLYDIRVSKRTSIN